MAKRIRVNRYVKPKEQPAAEAPPRKRRLIRRATVLAVLVGLAVWGCRAAARRIAASPLFVVSAIEIDAPGLDEHAVLKASGLQTGMHLSAVKPAAAQQRIERLPWVKHARLSRRLPDKVHIAVVRRTPLALVAMGNVHFMDDQGVLLPLDGGSTAGMPVVSGAFEAAKDSVGVLHMGAGDLTRVLRFLRAMRQEDPALAGDITQVQFRDNGSARFVLTKGTVVEVEEATLPREVDKLAQLLEVLRSESDTLPGRINLCHSNLAFVQ